MAGDAVEVGYKDQNSSIHMLEAYTELYRVWKDPRLKKQLTALLFLIRDRMVHSKGYLQLFFEPDFRPVSFRHFPAKMRDENFGLDHVSFGHDYETAFLMLEASHALGMELDERTLEVGKRMLDHALQFGWDEETGGFCDAGYYFTKDGPCTIVRRTKNWWAQAEGLNVLALFSRIFPGESRYRECLQRQWDYIDRCVIDHDRGDWFEGGIDHEPRFRTGPKSHIWKCTYHTSRALMNCLALFGDKDLPGMGERFDSRVREMEALVGELKRSANR
jgi:mannobiose 2-epimerase